MSVPYTNILDHPEFAIQVTKAAGKAHAAMPVANGRIERAVELVLAGGVQDDGGGRWSVASQGRFPEKWYLVVNGGCACPDYAAHAMLVPAHLCKHLCAVALYQQAILAMEKDEMMSEPLPQPAPCALPIDEDGTPCDASGACQGHDVPPDWSPLTVAAAGQLIADAATRWEAPAEVPTLPTVDEDEPEREDEPCEVRYTLMVAGHALTVHLSDTNDVRLMMRAEAMLEHYTGEHEDVCADCASEHQTPDVN